MVAFNNFIQSVRSEADYGKRFEIFVKWFLKNDPEWSTQVDRVWLWDEWPDRWGPDCGIDLIFRHKNGQTWAVQAKCYDPKNTISKGAIDTFLSESSRSSIDQRLLIATTDLISRNAERTCDGQEKRVIRYMLTDFNQAAIEYPASIADLGEGKRKTKPEPRPHQVRAIKDVTRGFSGQERGQLIMACGTGKTFASLWIKEALDAQSTLVLVPSLNLLSQTLREWTFAGKDPFEVLCVCSDQSVGNRLNSDAEGVRISEFAFPVTADIDEIRSFLGGEGSKVVFCTYHSSPLIAEAQVNASVPSFDLAIADEAHRCAGNAAGSFATILDGQRIRSAKRLFTTATPRIYSSTTTKRAEERGVEVIGMDDPEVFGPELHRLTFGQAIRSDPPLLSDYQVVIVGVDEPTIAEWINDAELVALEPDVATDARSLAAKIGLIKALRDYDLDRLISFHSRVKSAKMFASEIDEIFDLIPTNERPSGPIWSDYVSGDMATSLRTSKIEKLRALEVGQRGILTNARCLSEGVDVPALDGIAFVDPRASQVDIIQAVGRAIRLSDDKDLGTIILPVFIEAGDDPAQRIEASAFKPVWDVLKALRAHDEVLADQMDQLRTSMGRKSEARIETKPNKVVFDLPRTVDEDFATALATVLVERTTTSWNFWYGLLEEYVAQEGHARPANTYVTPEGHKLGSWVSDRRKSKDTLTPKRVDLLEALDGWVWDFGAWQWEQGFRKLVEFVAVKGHARPTNTYITPDGYKLGSWIGGQRNKKDTLSHERRKRLEALDGWVWDAVTWRWEEGFRHLEDFISREGHAPVPVRYVTPGGFKLGNWVSRQRKEKDTLEPELRERLEALDGWVWDIGTLQWEEGFRYVEGYVVRESNARVPGGYVTPEGYKLGIWVSRQRTDKDTLEPELRERLEALDGWVWDAVTWRWEEGFQHLADYVDREGHARVSRRYETTDGYKLGIWVSAQRKNETTLAPERRERLEALDGWVWDIKEAQWEEGFQHLEDYIAREGHARVPQVYATPEGYKLGTWVNWQRNKKDTLEPERRDRLEALDGWVWDFLTWQWEEGFQHLADYVDREGHAWVSRRYETTGGYKLGIWVSVQRKNETTLAPKRRERLEALDGWVWSIR
jgi:superfamily II DNA or RNA helicase